MALEETTWIDEHREGKNGLVGEKNGDDEDDSGDSTGNSEGCEDTTTADAAAKRRLFSVGWS